MKKNLILVMSATVLLYCGCSKGGNKENGPTNTGTAKVKIEIVSGSGQADTIGKALTNPIFVKVSQNGVPLNGYKVEFVGSGCNSDNIITVGTKADGTTGIYWWLAGDVGQQTMEVYAVNSQNQKVDSTSATATGIATGAGWHISACAIPFTDFTLTASSIVKLNSGRLFMCINGAQSYIRYSDDNGVSWNAVKSLGNTNQIDYLLSSSAGEIFAFAEGESTYYSNDAGQTWTALGTLPFSVSAVSSAVYTSSGKLLVATENQPLYISVDKGKTWTPSGAIANDHEFNTPAEDQQGNLYVVAQNSETLYKSVDGGKTWASIPHLNTLVFAFYIDSNNWFYVSRSEPGIGGIYISKDAGATYTQMVSYGNVFIENMSVQSNGNFYYQYLGVGLYQATGISTPVSRIFDYSANFSEFTPYVVAKNGNIITADVGESYVHYYTK